MAGRVQAVDAAPFDLLIQEYVDYLVRHPGRARTESAGVVNRDCTSWRAQLTATVADVTRRRHG